MPLDLDDAIALVSRAQANGLSLHMVGSAAVEFYARSLNIDSPRPERVKDLDLISRKAERRRVQKFFSSEGWELAQALLLYVEDRETFHSPNRDYSIDVFFNVVDGSHPIQLADRLDTHGPAVRVEDLLLTKLQRQSLRAADIWDLCVLLKRVDKSSNLTSFQQMTSKDWGFYTTVTDNLAILSTRCSNEKISICLLEDIAKSSQKSLAWKMRALLGRRLKWWREVYDAYGGQEQ